MSEIPLPQLVYVAAACNRYSNVADCRDDDGLVAFGSGRMVALWSSENDDSCGIHATLPGHLGNVTCLKFCRSQDGQKSIFFVSGDTAGGARVWRESEGQWSLHCALAGHTQSISALATLSLPDVEGPAAFLIVTGSSDGTLRSWKVTSSGAQLLQSFEIRGKIPLELDLTYLPGAKSLVLAVGCTENTIPIYSASAQDLLFTRALALEGHSDWVRSLSFYTPLPLPSVASSATPPAVIAGYDIAPGEILLASGSQDNYIRLWRITRVSFDTGDKVAPTGFEALDELERSLAEVGGEEGELRVKAHDFTLAGDGVFSCAAEAVLLGHDSWVTGLHWARSTLSTHSQQLRLLSASADRSLILWTPSESGTSSDSIWTNHRRFGEFSSATNLGFFGALWGKESNVVLAHGWGGSWHVWRTKDAEDAWEPILAVGGHFEAVKSIAWEPQGEYLLSAGFDMSTRLHAPWRRSTKHDSHRETWHEVGRPQIHGYPIACIAFTDRLQFVSGADEKIVRVFDAPKVCLASLTGLARVEGLGEEGDRPMAANVPPLGLSNRAIATAADVAEPVISTSNDPFSAPKATIDFTVATHPPFEEQLLGSTLWPEIEKLYGHGYEIIALANAHSSLLIATACKATLAEHAVVRLYDTRTWKTVGQVLEGHALTITSLRFSPDDRWLLSVSRDRSWRLFDSHGCDSELYRPSASSKVHARIIWDCCWAFDSSFFVTGSRDKTAKIWAQVEEQWIEEASLKFDEAVTAVAACHISDPSRHMLAVGLESGAIHLFTSPLSPTREWTLHTLLDPSIAHTLTVTSLAFCPRVIEDGAIIRLASGSEDRSTRIIDIATVAVN